jgi:acyl transferase domain-containing protein
MTNMTAVRDGLETAVAVIGRALRVPGARSVGEFWTNLCDGVESLTPLSDEDLRGAGVPERDLADPDYVKTAGLMPDMDRFDAGFFGLAPREAAIMDPQHRQFLECAWEALEDAGHVPHGFSGSIGVFGGSGMHAYLPYHLLTNPDLVRSYGLFLIRHTGNDKDFLTTRVSYAFDLRGPSVNVQTACSTSLVAIHLAVQSLLNGECDMALAGGVTIEVPHGVGYRYEPGGILSPDGHCRPFDAASKGTVFGSGAGVVVLRRLADALADGDLIHAVVRGSAVNNDGSRKVGYLAPSVDGQALAVGEALSIAGVSPDDISYVETHGTGTPVGDPIEIAALTQAFRAGTSRRGFCAIGSVKSNIGHLDTAAGVASFIKVVEALAHRELPPTLHFEQPNPAIDFAATPFVVNDRRREWPSPEGTPRRAAVSSLGVGGTNAHVVLEEAPAALSGGPSRRRHLLVLSARTPAALSDTARRLGHWLQTHPDANPADVAYTLQQGREPFLHRGAFVCDDLADAAQVLAAWPNERVRLGQAPEAGRAPVFMFAGGGAQYAGMGADLYATEPDYREAIDACLACLPAAIRGEVRGVLCEPSRHDSPADLSRPALALPALFAAQYAHARLLMSWGVGPAALIGHSMGEYTAACLSGVLTLEAAISLVALRGRLFERLPPGAMLSVPLAADRLAGQIDRTLAIAAVNAPELCVVSGQVAAIDRLERELAASGTPAHRLHIAVAAHSPMVEPILRDFAKYLRTMSFGTIGIPFVSNATGTWATDDDVRDPEYWVRHLRDTVRFADGVATLVADPNHVLLEVGPGRTLATLARLHPKRQSGQLVSSSMPHPDEPGPADAFILDALARLWTAGVPVDWRAFSARERRRRVSLPTYPFERQRHWIEPGAMRPAPGEETTDANDLPRKRADIGTWGYQYGWVPEPIRASDAPRGAAILLADDGGVADALAETLRQAGRPVITVRRGTTFESRGSDDYSVRPECEDDYRRLLADAAAGGREVSDLVHLWTLLRDDDAIATIRARAFGSLLAIARACDVVDPARPLSLTVVASGMQEIAGEGLPRPLDAMALGPCAVIPAECEGVRSRAIDLRLPEPGGRCWAPLIAQLADELGQPAANQVLAYRGPERFVRTYVPRQLEPSRPPRLRQGGTYLITGGSGGLGLALARHLGVACRAQVVLIGRTPLETRGSRPVDARTAARQRAFADARAAIEAAGGRVLAIEADVTSPEALAEAVDRATRECGPIHGVVHAAGVLRDALIAFKSDETAAGVLAPKVEGTLALDRVLADRPLDFLALYSSVSASAGLAGQADYAAASAFLDAFARHRSSRTGSWTVAIDWTPWQQIGMAADQVHGSLEDRGGPTGHPLLDAVRREGATDVFTTQFSVARHWLLDEHRLKDGQALMPGAGYVELARAALATEPEPKPVELSGLFFLTPFAVTDDAEKTLRLTLNRDAGEFAIASRTTPDGPWVDHVQGSVRYVESGPTPTVNLARLRARCAARDECVTEVVNREHLRLGPRWRNLRRIESGAREALLTLELDDEPAGEAALYGLHPALLDVATAGVPGLIEGFRPDQDFYVPVSYRRILVHAPLPPRVFSHVRCRPAEGSAAEFAVFDISIYDERGVELVDIDEFTMKRVDQGSLVPASAVSDAPASAGAGGPGERPANGPSRMARVLSEALTPEEGLDALRRILAGPPIPHVIVSPAPLEPWIRWMRRPPEPPRPDAGAAAAAAAPVISDEVALVEAALATHAAIREAAAAEVRDLDGEPRMIAYVVYDRDHHATVSELRKHVRASGAAALVPTQFLELPALPRLPGGAIDRRGLPNPFAPEDDYAPPATATGQLIADIWRELLDVPRVGGHDNFFNIGGHSLLSVHALARIQRRLGVSLQHADIVVNTLDQLAAKCDRLAAGRASAPATQESA